MVIIQLKVRSIRGIADTLDPRYSSIFSRTLTANDNNEILNCFQKLNSLEKVAKKTGFNILEIADTVAKDHRAKGFESLPFTKLDVALINSCRAHAEELNYRKTNMETHEPTSHEYDEGRWTPTSLFDYELSKEQLDWLFDPGVQLQLDNALRYCAFTFRTPDHKVEFLRDGAFDFLGLRLSKNQIPENLLFDPKNNGLLLHVIVKRCFIDALRKNRRQDNAVESYREYDEQILSHSIQERGSKDIEYNQGYGQELLDFLNKLKETIESRFAQSPRQTRLMLGRLDLIFQGYKLKDIADFYGTSEDVINMWSSSVLGKLNIEIDTPIFEASNTNAALAY